MAAPSRRNGEHESKQAARAKQVSGGPSRVVVLSLLCLLVASATIAAHWPVLSAQAISSDDDQYLTENQLVQHPSWNSVGRFLGEVRKPSSVEGYYQPLAMISLMLDFAMGGRPDHLRPFHRTSLILHAINTVLVIVLLQMLFGEPWVAAMVGLLFGVHPLTVEPVAWIGDRKTLLAAFFALGCFLFYVRYTRLQNWTRYVTCLVLYALALLSKPTSTPLPLVLLLLDFWPLRCFSKRTVIEKIPFFLIGGASAVITLISQRHLERSALPAYSVEQTLLLICHNLTFYPSKMIWPAHLSNLYPFPENLSLSNPLLLTSVLVSTAGLIFLLVSLRWTRALLTGVLSFCLLLAPTLFNKSYSPSVAWDKYAYLPAVGLLLSLGWLLKWIWSRGTASRRLHQAGMVAVVVLVAGLLATGTRRYLSHWQTTEELCNYTLRLAPHAGPVYNTRGLLYYARGDYDGAIQDYTMAIGTNPQFAEAYNNRGSAFYSKGDNLQAIRDYTKAIEADSSFAKPYNNRAVIYFVLKQYDSAWSDVQMCRRLGGTPTPDFLQALAEASGRKE